MTLLTELAYAGLIIIASLGVASISWVILKRYAASWAAKTRTPLDDIIIQVVRLPLYLSIILVGVNLALRRVGIFESYLRYLDMGFYAMWAVIIGYIFYRFTDSAVPVLARKADIPLTPAEVIRKTIKWIIVVATIVSLFAIVGIEMGGVISVIMLVLGTLIFLAFAAWSIMGNITAGVVLMIWRPIEVGDYIEISPDNIQGRVEDINLMFTRLRMKTGETMNIPNTMVLQKYVRNLSKPGTYLIQLSYKSSASQDPEAVSALLIDAAEKTEGILKNPKPFVKVKNIEDDAVVYELNAYIDRPAYHEEIASTLRLNVLKTLKSSQGH